MLYWYLQQGTIAHAEMSKLTGQPENEQHMLFQYIPKRRERRFDLIVSDAIAMVALSRTWNANVPIPSVAPNLVGLINATLLHLALATMPWPFQGTSEKESEFRQWLEGGRRIAGERRVQELLGIAERPQNRLLAIDTAGTPLTTDDEAEVSDMRFVLDASDLADHIQTLGRNDLFVAMPSDGPGRLR